MPTLSTLSTATFCRQSSASQLVKKFYTDVSVRQVAQPSPDMPRHRYEVLLNGAPVKTSKRNVMRLPSEELAFLVRSEFEAQTDFMKFATMPLFTLSKTSVDIDFVSTQRQNLLASLLAMVDTDTAVYREDPRTQLGKLQHNKLTPCLDYVNQKYGLGLKENFGLQNNDLSAEQLAGLEERLAGWDNWELLGVEQLASVYKSTTLALCVQDGFLSWQDAFWRSRIEETYQAQKFGYVEGSHDMDESYLQFVSASAHLFLRCL